MVDGKLREIGYKLELAGTHDAPKHPPSPGCPECAPVAAALHRIAEYLLPRDERASFYEVHADSALHFFNDHGARPELRLTITILHSEGINRPVDSCESRCRDEMLDKLKQLGACEGKWHSGTT